MIIFGLLWWEKALVTYLARNSHIILPKSVFTRIDLNQAWKNFTAAWELRSPFHVEGFRSIWFLTRLYFGAMGSSILTFLGKSEASVSPNNSAISSNDFPPVSGSKKKYMKAATKLLAMKSE